MSGVMTDAELAAFLGIENEPKRDAFIAKLSLEKRALFDRMREVEIEANLWTGGLGPKPKGVLLDTERAMRRRKLARPFIT